MMINAERNLERRSLAPASPDRVPVVGATANPGAGDPLRMLAMSGLALASALLGDRSRSGTLFEAALAELSGESPLERGDPGEAEKARRLLQEAIDGYERMKMPKHREVGQELLASMSAAGGRKSIPSPNSFRREGDYWTLAYDGKPTRVKDTKGLRDIAWLLANPGKEVHVADLIAAGEQVPPDPSLRTADAALLDARARSEYRSRLSELHSELEDAESRNDLGRVAKLKAELDFLAGELASAFGLGGRARRESHPAERARTAVTMRIRYAIARIRRVQPDLAHHLEGSIHTGTFCSYLPRETIRWSF